MMDTFARNEDKTFPEIVAIFKDLYVPSKTILDYSNQLDTFARQPGETLRTAQARFTQLLHETEHLYPEHQRQTRREFETEQLLFNISSPKAAAHLREIKARAQTRGLPVSSKQYLEAAEEAEYIYRDAPTIPTPNKSVSRPTVEQRQIPLFAIAAQPTPVETKIAQQVLKPPLTGANTMPLGPQNATTASTAMQDLPKTQPTATIARIPPACRHCNSTDPTHVWKECKQNPAVIRQTQNKPPVSNQADNSRTACFKCGSTHKHTWNTCQGTKMTQTQTRPPAGTNPRPCPTCGDTSPHNWKQCTMTPLAIPKPVKQTMQPCYRCGSNILHNWRECTGIPPSTPQTSQACFKCGSKEYHKWNLCQGIPPNYLQDPQFMQFAQGSQLPNLQHIIYQQPQPQQMIMQLPQPPQIQPRPAMIQNNPAQHDVTQSQPQRTQRRACYKCGSNASHNWNTCTNPRLDGLPLPPLTQVAPARAPRPCPHCSGTDRHDWKICGDTIAAVAALNLQG